MYFNHEFVKGKSIFVHFNVNLIVFVCIKLFGCFCVLKANNLLSHNCSKNILQGLQEKTLIGLLTT